MGIHATQLENIFDTGTVFKREANLKFNLQIDSGTIVNDTGTLKVGVVQAVNIAAGAIDATAVGFVSTDIPHSSVARL